MTGDAIEGREVFCRLEVVEGLVEKLISTASVLVLLQSSETHMVCNCCLASGRYDLHDRDPRRAAFRMCKQY
jgi:hypothetical protein